MLCPLLLMRMRSMQLLSLPLLSLLLLSLLLLPPLLLIMLCCKQRMLLHQLRVQLGVAGLGSIISSLLPSCTRGDGASAATRTTPVHIRVHRPHVKGWSGHTRGKP